MMYASVEEVAAGFRDLDADEVERCEALLSEAAIIIDVYNANATYDAKKLVSCRMVRRALGDGGNAQALPYGATQGSISAGGYSQSWTIGNGSAGELYLEKTEKKILGIGSRIGSYSPVQEKVVARD